MFKKGVKRSHHHRPQNKNAEQIAYKEVWICRLKTAIVVLLRFPHLIRFSIVVCDGVHCKIEQSLWTNLMWSCLLYCFRNGTMVKWYFDTNDSWDVLMEQSKNCVPIQNGTYTLTYKWMCCNGKGFFYFSTMGPAVCQLKLFVIRPFLLQTWLQTWWYCVYKCGRKLVFW